MGIIPAGHGHSHPCPGMAVPWCWVLSGNSVGTSPPPLIQNPNTSLCRDCNLLGVTITHGLGQWADGKGRLISQLPSQTSHSHFAPGPENFAGDPTVVSTWSALPLFSTCLIHNNNNNNNSNYYLLNSSLFAKHVRLQGRQDIQRWL